MICMSLAEVSVGCCDRNRLSLGMDNASKSEKSIINFGKSNIGT